MHIPDGFLDAKTLALTGALSVGGLAVAARRDGPGHGNVAASRGRQLQARIQEHGHLVQRRVMRLEPPLCRDFQAAEREVVGARLPQEHQQRALACSSAAPVRELVRREIERLFPSYLIQERAPDAGSAPGDA